jgi:hypothetical protein
LWTAYSLDFAAGVGRISEASSAILAEDRVSTMVRDHRRVTGFALIRPTPPTRARAASRGR